MVLSQRFRLVNTVRRDREGWHQKGWGRMHMFDDEIPVKMNINKSLPSNIIDRGPATNSPSLYSILSL